MAIVNYPEFLQTQSYTASRLRFQQEDFTPAGEGVMGQSDFRVAQRGAGANMSVDIAAGSAVVRGDTIARQGFYHVVNDATINAAITSNSSGNPRVDRVTLQCSDSTDSGSGTDISVINVLAGTPVGGATLDNLSGAQNIPNNQLHLADVVVANGAASITDANIRSRRTFAKPLIPPLVGLTDVDQVPLVPAAGLAVISNAALSVSHTTLQTAILVTIPRRIVGATKLRWRYAQNSAAAMTGNYIFAIYDASGRAVAATSSTAFTGATSSIQVRSEALTATTTFEAGAYYLFMGNTATTASSTIGFVGVGPPAAATGETIGGSGVASTLLAGQPGVLLKNASGGVTLPAAGTILGMQDIGTVAGTNAVAGIPVVSLSVA